MERNMNLYLIHCGFYDDATSVGGVFESHTNFFLVAESPEAARRKAKAVDFFKARRMHVDGIQQIDAVDGYRVTLIPDAADAQASDIQSFQFRDLAPRQPQP
jgi:hypothetical protein